MTDADRADRGQPLAYEESREEDAQIRELIKRNRLLEQENEVLRRAATYMSQIHITPQNSIRARPGNGCGRRSGQGACRGGMQGARVHQTGVLPMGKTAQSNREVKEAHLVEALHKIHKEDLPGSDTGSSPMSSST